MDGSKGLILVSIDMDAVKSAFSRLSVKEQNKALKKALRATAEKARLRLAEKAQDSYTIKNAGFKRSMRIRTSATSAVIRSEGMSLPLRNFKISKAKNTVRAQVVKPGHLKELKRGDIKAFVDNIAKKGHTRTRTAGKGVKGSAVRHLAVAEREGKKRLPIHELFSKSVPSMLGSEKRVYGIVEPEIGNDLQTYLQKFIDTALGG